MPFYMPGINIKQGRKIDLRTVKRTIKSTQGVNKMTRTMPIIEARKKLTSLPEELEHESGQDVVAVTRRGKPVLALMSWDLYEAVNETLEVAGDRDLMIKLRQSVNEIKAGKAVPWEKVWKTLMK